MTIVFSMPVTSLIRYFHRKENFQKEENLLSNNSAPPAEPQDVEESHGRGTAVGGNRNSVPGPVSPTASLRADPGHQGRRRREREAQRRGERNPKAKPVTMDRTSSVSKPSDLSQTLFKPAQHLDTTL